MRINVTSLKQPIAREIAEDGVDLKALDGNFKGISKKGRIIETPTFLEKEQKDIQAACGMLCPW